MIPPIFISASLNGVLPPQPCGDVAFGLVASGTTHHFRMSQSEAIYLAYAVLEAVALQSDRSSGMSIADGSPDSGQSQ